MKNRFVRLVLALGLLLILVTACEDQPTFTPVPISATLDPNTLVIATSPEMTPLLGKLADQFNRQQNGNKNLLKVGVLTISPADMVAAALKPDPPFHALNPDSGIWLSKLSNEWGKAFASETAAADSLPIPRQRYTLPVRFATSPVVIAMWEKVAQSMGWPGKALGWSTLQERASQDSTFRWNHPSTSYASGLLATLAEFYAGAKVSRDLTEALATQESTLEYVRKLESTIRFYGEGESAILDRLKKDGVSLLDAFVAQEQIILRWNNENPTQKLVAVYPVEGTLWADHPLALLERYADYDQATLSNARRDTFYEFSRYLLTVDAQKQVLAGGYRPVNTDISLQGEPFKSNPSVDPLQPKTTLQIPPYSVIQVIEDYRAYIKKPTNVILVVDTSGSMSTSDKLPKVKTALVSFIGNISGKKDRLGLIEFGDSVKYSSGLGLVTQTYKNQIISRVNSMGAGGNTAVLDSVLEAYNQLQKLGDSEAINAIVVMTDGKENASRQIKLDALAQTITRGKVPVVVFSIAFGSDADTTIMKRLAEATNGQYRPANSFNIEELYKIISTYF